VGLNVEWEVARLKAMNVAELRAEFERVWGCPAWSRNKPHLIRRICWRLQANEQGGLSEEAIQRARQIASWAPVRLRASPDVCDLVRQGATGLPPRRDPRLPPPGSVITRQYKNATIEVTVLDRGFEWNGGRYRTLSACARAITGSHLNGFAFFRLGPKETK